MSIARALLGVVLGAVALAAASVGAGAEPVAPPLAGSASSSPAADGRTPAEPRVQRLVDEDDHVRIEELRVRGESQRIVVKPKGQNAKEYEIVPTSGAIDPSQGHRRTARERMWRVFSF